ncbi:MAG: gluconokinase [Mesorhizobium amorphae]|nr:MAG: gluconokinase [Mesorhizobium amorphae]
MGVSGAGKTSVGEALAPKLGAVFLDGDAFHPEANIAKMSRGEPLDDADRAPWLDRIGHIMRDEPGRVVMGCSALKRAYRTRIERAAGEPVLFVLLEGSPALIRERIAHRRNHFMPPALLDSQFAALEPPGPDENAIRVSVKGPTRKVVDAILRRLRAM